MKTCTRCNLATTQGAVFTRTKRGFARDICDTCFKEFGKLRAGRPSDMDRIITNTQILETYQENGFTVHRLATEHAPGSISPNFVPLRTTITPQFY